MIAVDTNVLIYARDPRDPHRQKTAVDLIRTIDDGALLWQVACEYVAASRKLAPHGFDTAAAITDLNDLRAIWVTVLPDWRSFDTAAALQTRHSLSWWDALLIGAAIEAGVDKLLTEDLSPGLAIEGIQICNPFVAK